MAGLLNYRLTLDGYRLNTRSSSCFPAHPSAGFFIPTFIVPPLGRMPRFREGLLGGSPHIFFTKNTLSVSVRA